ncbi:MAG: hypothetical protein AAF184_15730 [Pseudomonadota bacterium]
MTVISRFGPVAGTLYIAFVFIQSLFFKFTGSVETTHIFGTLDAWASHAFGIEGLFLAPGPFNAYVIGSAELVASVLLLMGLIAGGLWLRLAGSLLALGIISGAIVFHLFTPLGIVVLDDGGLLFAMAVGVWVTAAALAYSSASRLGLLTRRATLQAAAA